MTTTTAGPVPVEAAKPNSFRPDIQGLRAVAVLLVIANHFLGWPGGGFIGVDVFFVISGFVITGTLMRQHDRSGRISFTGFYARRVRRILPAALVVTVTTVVVGWILFTQARFESLFGDAVWATLFSANWRLIILGTDYMHMGDAVSPLQHYWSLSIEEQFYFVWPLILLAGLALSVRHGRRSAALVLGGLAALSFAWAVWESITNPASAYFSTFSRAWELSAGALLALGVNRLASIPPRVRPWLAWAGLGIIAIGMFVCGPDTLFPGPFALLPVVGAAAVIAASVGGVSRTLWPLTNPVTRYIGDISYSLYLWHWPVFVFVGVFLGGTPKRLALVALVITFALSMASYRWIENPARRTRGIRAALIPAVAALAIIGLAAGSAAAVPRATAKPVVVAGARTYADTAAGRLSRSIDEALATTSWPELTPSIDTIGPADKAPEWVVDGCLGAETGALPDPIENAKRCVYGDEGATKTAVVLGDSVAISWLPGIREALEPLGYRIDVMTVQRCPIVDVAITAPGFDQAQCDAFRAWALGTVSRLRPDLVIASNVSWDIQLLTSGAVGDAAAAEWQTAATRAYSALEASTPNLVVLQGPPAGLGFDTCATRGSTPADCLLVRTPNYALMDAATSAAVPEGARYIRTESWFCSPEGYCPSFVDGTPVLADGSHLTAAHSRALADVLREALEIP